MIKFLVGMVKFSLFTLAVLLLSQVQYDGKRICDHVASGIQSTPIQSGIRWISSNVNPKQKQGGRSRIEPRPAVENVGSEDKAVLSGLLKKR